MPAGKTHDRITLYLAPLVIGVTFGVTRSERLSLLMAIAFVFSGLMFGPDLDIHSCQYKRWGWLRWVWLPYRAMVRHRSPLSHGFLIGTILRLVYVACWALVIGLAITVCRVTAATGECSFCQLAGGANLDLWAPLGVGNNFPWLRAWSHEP